LCKEVQELALSFLCALDDHRIVSPPTITSRNLSGTVLGALVAAIPEVVGGSADLTPSNKTHWKGAVDFQKETPIGRYMRFGVREHAMSAICNVSPGA
jgi:transketolase